MVFYVALDTSANDVQKLLTKLVILSNERITMLSGHSSDSIEPINCDDKLKNTNG